jgi:hypothetical protein
LGRRLSRHEAFAEYNDVVRYLFAVVDTFSKYSWVVELKDESEKLVANPFNKILNENGRKPEKSWIGEGKLIL